MNNVLGFKVKASQFTPGTLSTLKLQELCSLNSPSLFSLKLTSIKKSASGFQDGELTSHPVRAKQRMTTQTSSILPFFCPCLKPYEITHSSSLKQCAAQGQLHQSRKCYHGCPGCQLTFQQQDEIVGTQESPTLSSNNNFNISEHQPSSEHATGSQTGTKDTHICTKERPSWEVYLPDGWTTPPTGLFLLQ